MIFLLENHLTHTINSDNSYNYVLMFVVIWSKIKSAVIEQDSSINPNFPCLTFYLTF